jgi:hypothetical protein
LLTWAVKPLAPGNIKHDPRDREQDPPTVAPVELCEGAWGIRGEEQWRGVRTGHPRVALGVASFELCRGAARDRSGGKENALEEVEDVEEQGGVDWVREQGRHLVGVQ